MTIPQAIHALGGDTDDGPGLMELQALLLDDAAERLGLSAEGMLASAAELIAGTIRTRWDDNWPAFVVEQRVRRWAITKGI